MTHAETRGRRGLVPAALLAWSVVACVTEVPATEPAATGSPQRTATIAPPTRTPAPFSPTELVLHRIDRTFADVTALMSTGEALYWASGGEVWRFAPGEADATLVYDNPTDGALVWDVAVSGDGYVISEELPKPAGSWRVLYAAGDAPPVQVDAGIANRGRPPTVALDSAHLAWAGFDESTGSPRSFLRFVGRSDPGTPSTLLDAVIEDRLLWYPELDGDTLWYSTIDPDFEATGAGDEVHIETLDLLDPATRPVRFEGDGLDFSVVVSPDHVVWKSLEPGFSALSWGELHVLDRHTGERFVIPGQADHPSVGTRYIAFEEFRHEQLLVYDLVTRSAVEIPGALHDGRGTIGVPVISGGLLGFSTSTRGETSVFWAILPD